ncbi:MAG: hypothetical protein ACI9TF_001775 [Paracrocinitomix sp.]|jgi:hypothetical protein
MRWLQDDFVEPGAEPEQNGTESDVERLVVPQH